VFQFIYLISQSPLLLVSPAVNAKACAAGIIVRCYKMLSVIIYAVIFLIPLFSITFLVFTSPNGWEDENGFHSGYKEQCKIFNFIIEDSAHKKHSKYNRGLTKGKH